MKKSYDDKHIKSLHGIKKIKSKSHCKLIRNEQGLIILCEVNVVLEKANPKKLYSKKGFLRFFKAIKFTGKLLRRIMLKLFGL